MKSYISDRLDNIKDLIRLESMITTWKQSPEYQNSESCRDELKHKIDKLGIL